MIKHQGDKGNRSACQNCAKKGHVALACHNRHNEDDYPTPLEYRTRQLQNQKKKAVNAVWTPVLESPPQVNALWNPDTEATGHVSGTVNVLHHPKSAKNHPGIVIADGATVPVDATGDSKFLKQGKDICVKDISVVPSISRNLLSVNRLCNDNNIGCWFIRFSMAMIDLQTKEVLVRG